MAISEFRTDRIGRMIAASQLLSEAKANDPQGIGASEAAKLAMWAGWSQLLRIGARVKHSDIPVAGTRITLRDRVKAARVVVVEVEPRADEDVLLGLHVFQLAQYAFDRVVQEYGPGAPKGDLGGA